MVTIVYLASAVTMAVALAVVLLVVARGRTWRKYAPDRGTAGGRRIGGRHDERTWRAGFLVLCVAAIGGTVVSLGSDGAAAMLGALGLAVTGFLAFAVYGVATARGHPRSHAVGEALVAVGALALVAVVVQLLVTAGP